MIEVRNLRKTYGRTVAVDDLSFHVAAGEILGFLGPNGAGKTSTMRMLTCFTTPTSGTIRIDGFDLPRHSPEVRQILGYLPENAPVYGDMTIRAFLTFIARAKRISPAACGPAVDQALEECGLTDSADRLLRNLSKGMRQRAGLAQAVVGDPKVLILDEPTSGLDPIQIREIRQLIRAMAGRRTVILSTHLLPEVSLTCTEVLIINKGRVVASGCPENLTSQAALSNRIYLTLRSDPDKARQWLERQAHVRLVTLLDARSDAAGFAAECDYELTIEAECDIRADLTRGLVEAGFHLLEIRSSAMSLEDIFLHTLADDEKPTLT